MNARLIVLMVAAAGCPIAQAEGLAIKTGAWEMKWATRIDMPGPPAGLDKLTPEQRARYQAALKARAGQTREVSERQCVTKQDLAQMAKGQSEDGDCKPKNVVASGNAWRADMACTHGRSGYIEITALSPESTKGSMLMNAPSASGQGTVQMTMTGKWLGADCKKFDAD